MLSQILSSTGFSFSTKMQRLSDVMSNVNLTLYRRLVPAGFIFFKQNIIYFENENIIEGMFLTIPVSFSHCL